MDALSLNRAIILCAGHHFPVIFLTAGHFLHHRSFTIVSGSLSALRYTPQYSLKALGTSFSGPRGTILLFPCFRPKSASFCLNRLAGDVRRRRRRDHLLVVLVTIWNPAVSSPCAAVAGAAGDKPSNPSVVFVG